MRMNVELLRRILLAAESSPSGILQKAIEVEGYSQGDIDYHSSLIIDAGLAIGTIGEWEDRENPLVVLHRLTYKGHEFIEAARNEFIWDEALSIMKEKGFVPASIELVKKVLDKQIRKQLEIE